MLIRRSNLLLPVTDADAVHAAWRHNSDAVTLDLGNAADPKRNADARGLLKSSIAIAGKGGAEVFVRVNKPHLHEDLRAAVWPGLTGIVLPQIESAAEVQEAAELATALERERGMAGGSLTFIVLLESARAIWDVRSIIAASPRITQVGLEERNLASALGFDPQPQYDPFVYARGRVVVEAIAAKVRPIGIAYPLSVEQREAPADEIHMLATTAKNLGMKGVICPHASWVEPVNAAFTPTAELVAYNKRVREAFAAGVALGTAAVPLDGRMIDVPVDEWAIVVLATAEACAARDAEKRAARQAVT